MTVIQRAQSAGRSLACRALTLRPCREEETILLTGSPRSGTTWVGAMLSFERDRAMVTEPLRLGLAGVKEAGFEWRTHREQDESWPEGEAFLRRLFRGRGIPPGVLRDNDWATLLRYRRILIKSVRANRLLPWIAHRFGLGGMVHLVRHPCAVVASQIAHPAFPAHGVTDFDRRYVDRHLPHLRSRLDGLRHEDEIRALTWALDQHVPMASSLRNRWLVLPYERLVTDGEEELERALAHLALRPTAEARARLRRSSREAHAWSADHTRADLGERLGGWRRRLSPEQIRRVLDVVEAVGLRGWSEDLVPDADDLGVVEGPGP